MKMANQIIITILLIVGFGFIILISEFVFKKFSLNPEYTRKLTHIITTLASLIFIVIIDSHWYVLLISLVFFVILLFTKYKGFLKSIDSVERKTGGSFLLPISIYIVFYFYKTIDNKLFYILPILILGISDPLAGLFGHTFTLRTKKIKIIGLQLDKTILGSSVFFISTLIISSITLYFYGLPFQQVILHSIVFAIVSSITEMFSPYGTDNLTVPLATLLLLKNIL